MPSRSSVSGAIALLVAAAALGGCSSEQEPDADATLRVYVSLPLSGPSAADGQDAADGAELALADAGGEAGGLMVEAVVLDDTEGEEPQAGWTPVKAAANAREAISDSTGIAYVGDFESGATRASLPITSEARMLQVSPASSAEDLVAPFVGSDELPELQASAGRSFGRVIPGDVVQATAAAGWVERMGLRRVATLSDRTEFGRTLVSAFRDQLSSTVVSRRAGTLYFGGTPEMQPASLSQSIPRLIVSDAAIAGGSSRQPAGTLATSAALDPSHLPAAGQELVADFEAEYGRAPGRYAAYGYEAMAVVLDSIERAEDPADRSSVISAFFETSERETTLGSYSIDEVGQTTLERISGYKLGRGPPKPVIELDAG